MTFRIQLPVSDVTVAEHAANVVIAPRTLPPIRVLVVDDQADVRSVAVRILHDAGCSVIEAATAEDARKI